MMMTNERIRKQAREKGKHLLLLLDHLHNQISMRKQTMTTKCLHSNKNKNDDIPIAKERKIKIL